PLLVHCLSALLLYSDYHLRVLHSFPTRRSSDLFCSRARLKISKGQVVFFEKITQKISTFKPLPIFILSVLSSLPKARLSKNKIFIVFRFSSVTDKTTQK